MANYEITIDNRKTNVHISDQEDWAEIDGLKTPFSVHMFNNHTRYLRLGSRMLRIDNITKNGHEVEFSVDGKTVTAQVMDEQSLLLQKLGFSSQTNTSSGSLQSPMPGKILELLVQIGEDVEKDQPLVILEAMKMENELKAPSAGTISEIHVKPSQNVDKKQPILTIQPRA